MRHILLLAVVALLATSAFAQREGRARREGALGAGRRGKRGARIRIRGAGNGGTRALRLADDMEPSATQKPIMGRRLLDDAQTPRPETPSDLPSEDAAVAMDCTGWPDGPRRYVEAQHWWTDELSTEASVASSRRFSVGACVPASGEIKGPAWFDVVLRMYNCAGTRRDIDIVRVYLGGNAVDGYDELGFDCCEGECHQVFRLYAGALDENLNTTLSLVAVMKTSSINKLPDNLFARVSVTIPLAVRNPDVTNWNSDSGYYQSRAAYAQSWTRLPWNYVNMEIDQLPPADSPLGPGSTPIAYNVEVKSDSDQQPTPVNISSMLVAVDVPLNETVITPAVDGQVLLKYRRFSMRAISQTPFLDADSASLAAGDHTLLIRHDAFMPSAASPYANEAGATKERKAGGTASLGFLTTFKVKKP
eukprot:CAMPEP_0202865368 /NCGR_PEP_ID=MMETSP1391-20130828/5820_1 /ASSEMBLY_ACC=CAM_ASM_000867 /TAXON_ID=1034604 /ORGANISM="Chlamydomonas leiostraca, Strain SAG 11-49" /LENGTH=418 /DNA_ID=CAMNT_0049545205 /DNA_START=97 /DNA_END=1353 /DNA_ORIENTATION=+